MGHPMRDPEGRPWTLLRAMQVYGVPVPLFILQLCNVRTAMQAERERADLERRSARAYADEMRRLREDRAAAEWEASGHGAQ